jgi:triacylglycerol esterase/lipase EstA (alpha/beta hydrolase family)
MEFCCPALFNGGMAPMTVTRFITAALLAMGMAVGLSAPAAADSDAPVEQVPLVAGPPQTDHGAAMVYSRTHPGSIPAGVNDFACRPSRRHPYPVVLAHGTDSTAYSDWAGLAPSLVSGGFCVFALNYGGRAGATTFGTEDMRAGSAQVAGFVHRVLAATGAAKVDLVGFSQGATITRYFVNRLGGAAVVDRWVGLASPTYGGVFYGVVPVVEAVPGLTSIAQRVTSVAVVEQMQGSPYLTALNAGGDTVAGVRYTTIGSRYDEMIQPYTNVALRSAGATNIVIQDLCPVDLTGHFNMPYDRFAQGLVLRALDPGVSLPSCVGVPLGTGIPSVVWAAHTP